MGCLPGFAAGGELLDPCVKQGAGHIFWNQRNAAFGSSASALRRRRESVHRLTHRLHHISDINAGFCAHVSSTNSHIPGCLSAFIVSVPRSISDVGPVGWSFLLRSVPVSSLCCSPKASIVSGSASCAQVSAPPFHSSTLLVSNLLERQPGLYIVQTPRETDHRVGEHSVVVDSVGDRTVGVGRRNGGPQGWGPPQKGGEPRRFHLGLRFRCRKLSLETFVRG